MRRFCRNCLAGLVALLETVLHPRHYDAGEDGKKTVAKNRDDYPDETPKRRHGTETMRAGLGEHLDTPPSHWHSAYFWLRVMLGRIHEQDKESKQQQHEYEHGQQTLCLFLDDLGNHGKRRRILRHLP